MGSSKRAVRCWRQLLSVAAMACLLLGTTAFGQSSPSLKLLFLGDNGHHQPAERFRQILPILAKRGIDLTYTDKVAAVNPRTLAAYDGLIIYANTTQIAPEQEQALVDFVEGGKGFIPLHCASYCFLNSPRYIALVGAQFLRHGTGTFRTVITAPDHPVMKGFSGFESWDETYVHTKHNPDRRTVLEVRVDGPNREPWTWVRTQGKGRVFYTAWGHDHRTWGNPGFQNLLERGIRWATQHDPSVVAEYHADQPFPIPEMTPLRKDVAPFAYVDVGKKIPNYTPGRTWGTQGEPLSKMQRPLAPEESIKHLVTPKGFHVELFVSEAQLGGGKPICMNWDERGRLWISLTFDYPNNLQPAGQGNDRIVVCEDTKGAGKADKVTVFAEKLSIPTSIMFAQGGVICFESRRTVFLKDTDGDGKADERTVLFGNWAMGDTHGGPSNMQYGLDNWIWAMQGYNPSRLRVGGETHEFRQGFFRFTPPAPAGNNGAAVQKLEFIRSTDNNTWGLGISEEGIIFGSTANHNPSVYMPIPNRYYEAVRGWAPSLMLHTIADSYLFHAITDKVRQVDQHGGYTAGAGHSLYTARHYPQEYWNRTAFVAEPTGHLVGTFILRRDGSGFRSSNPFNLLASDDEWTAPIMAEVGPDGNVWVIDWYNYIVQHNPTPIGFRTGRGAAYETDLRDKKYGRVYRVVYDGQGDKDRPDKGFSLAGAAPETLVATLKHDNMFWRKHAQRLLVERGQTDVVPALCALVRDPGVDALGLNVGAIHALWTLHGLHALDGSNAEAVAVAEASLKHKSPGVRRNAVQVLPKSPESVSAILGAGLVQDSDAQVRLMALLALADQPPAPAAAAAVIASLSDAAAGTDPWLGDAATCAAAKNSENFLRALAAQKDSTPRLRAAAGIVAEHYARGGPVDSVGSVVAQLVQGDPRVIEVVIRGLAKGWPAKQLPRLDEPLEQALEQLSQRLAPAERGLVIKLATGWGSKRFEKYAAETARALLARIKNESLNPEERMSAARELVGQRSGDAALTQELLDQLSPRTPPELALGLLSALRQSDAPTTGRLILERLPGLTPAARSASLGVLLGRPEWTKSLLESAEKGELRLAELSLDQKQSLIDYPDRTLRRRAKELLERGGVLPNADRQKVLTDYLPITKVKGDAAAGKTVFKNTCAKCHMHSGEGQRIGPDLTGMAVHTKEHLLTDILDPTRSVEGNFKAYTVVTTAGQVLTGLLASESRTAIELFDVEGKKQTVLRADIDQLVASSKSLMPEGFEKQLTRQDLTNVLEFLTQRGKYLPLPLGKAATVVTTRGMFYNSEDRTERLIFNDWSVKVFEGVPFYLIDPQGGRMPNAVLLYGPQGTMPPRMPKAVTLPCNAPAKAIHFLSGVSGWGYPLGEKGSVSLIVRLHYEDGSTEDQPLKNGIHFADYIRRVDVPESKFAFNLRGRQLRYFAVHPQRTATIKEIELVKGPDDTAPVIMAVTVEAPQS